jgi:beta-lactamase superfamily II metal-dependent hydrolase
MGYEVDFLAVGEQKSGDAIALRYGNLYGNRNEQMVVVIDGGYPESGDAIVNHINQYYDTNVVDLVISTHPDADHASGLERVLERSVVGRLWMHLPWNHTDEIARMFKNGRVTDMSVSASLRKSLDNARTLEQLAASKGIPITEPFAGTRDPGGNLIVLGPSVDFYESLLPDFRCTPEAKTAASLAIERLVRALQEAAVKLAETWHIETLTDSGQTSAENNSSTILVLGIGDHFLLFTSDAGIPALNDALDRLDEAGFNPYHFNWIQVPHHGSRRNVGSTLLDRLLGPKLPGEAVTKAAFVSVARDGMPKHPSKRVTNAFRRRGFAVHATAGTARRQYHNAPERPGWVASTPLPFYNEVEETSDN